MKLKIGDYVQAKEAITEEDFMGEKLWTHARKGGLGHVLELLQDGWAFVFFERTETATICQVDELTWIGSADTGKAAASF